MKEKITLDSREVDALIQDLEGWAECLESDPGGGEHSWIEEMQAKAKKDHSLCVGRTIYEAE